MNNMNPEVFQKMIFIYNAVLDGWTVSQVENNEIKFKKRKQETIKNLQQFVQNNLKIPDNLKNN